MAGEDEENVDVPLLQVVVVLVVETVLVADLVDLVKDDDVLKDLLRAVVVHVDVVVLGDVDELLVLDLLVIDVVVSLVVVLSDADLDVSADDVLILLALAVVLVDVLDSLVVVVVDLYVYAAALVADLLVKTVGTLDVDVLTLFVVDH